MKTGYRLLFCVVTSGQLDPKCSHPSKVRKNGSVGIFPVATYLLAQSEKKVKGFNRQRRRIAPLIFFSLCAFLWCAAGIYSLEPLRHDWAAGVG